MCAGLALAAVAGCREEDPALAPACREGPGDVLRALRAAPADVRLDGDTPLSECLENAEDGGQLADVGTGYVAAAQRLADRARREPDGPAAEQLGYLVGAMRRGRSPTRARATSWSGAWRARPRGPIAARPRSGAGCGRAVALDSLRQAPPRSERDTWP